MNILSTEYDLKHKALEIYVAGCDAPHCKGCHNPETWSFNQGTPYELMKASLEQKIGNFGSLINNVVVMGGEPLHQDLNGLLDLLHLAKAYNKKVWVFTRYNLKDVPDCVKGVCDYVKCGQYIANSEPYDCHGYTLASSNQRIYSAAEMTEGCNGGSINE